MKLQQSKKMNSNVKRNNEKRNTNNSSASSKTNFSRTVTNKNPRVNNSSRTSKLSDGTVFRHREYIANISPSGNFTPRKVEINPGLKDTYPWLSGVAPNFQKYKFRKLRFVYETAQSTFIPGMVMFAPNFNVIDDLPYDKGAMLQLSHAKRAPVWQNFAMDIPLKEMESYKYYFVRTTTVSNLLLTDPLYLIVATDAVSTDIAYCGELWIEYEIEFIFPITINQDELLYTGYAHFPITTASTNPYPALGVGLKDNGGLNVTINGGQQDVVKISFGQYFTGILMLIVNSSGDGLTFFDHLPNIGYVQSTGSSGSAQLGWKVGGYGDSGVGYYEITFGIFDAVPGDLMTLDSLAIPTSEHIVTGEFVFLLCEDPFLVIPPPSGKITNTQFKFDEDEVDNDLKLLDNHIIRPKPSELISRENFKIAPLPCKNKRTIILEENPSPVKRNKGRPKKDL